MQEWSFAYEQTIYLCSVLFILSCIALPVSPIYTLPHIIHALIREWALISGNMVMHIKELPLQTHRDINNLNAGAQWKPNCPLHVY